MRKAVVLRLLAFGVVVACSQTLHAQPLEEGRWTGYLVSPTGELFDVGYEVAAEAGALNVTMVWSRGPSPLYDVRLERDTLWFSWNMESDFRLNCIMLLEQRSHYKGSCKGPYGGFGLMVMAPPGVEVSSDSIDPDALIAIWDGVAVPEAWAEERKPEPERLTMNEIFERDALEGTAVDIGGYSLNVFEAGEGDVTVVLEAGLGDDLRVWSLVLDEVALDARVVAYDRAGLGYSDPNPGPRTPEQMATELHLLLRKMGIEPPLVLVGHAEGGLVIRRFASLYPGEVAGIVLVDATHEKQGVRWRALSAKSWDDYVRRQAALHALLTDAVQAEYEAFASVLEEAEVPGLRALPEVPVVVLTAMRPVEEPRWIGETPEGQQAKYELHQAWVDQVVNGTHVVTEASGPYIHREEPERVIRAIRQILEAIQGSR